MIVGGTSSARHQWCISEATIRWLMEGRKVLGPCYPNQIDGLLHLLGLFHSC